MVRQAHHEDSRGASSHSAGSPASLTNDSPANPTRDSAVNLTQDSPADLTLSLSTGEVRGTPFSAGSVIPVTIITEGIFNLPHGAALITMEPEAGHDHDGAECLVCNARGNVRVRLFELLEEARTRAVAPFSSVIIDARQARDPQAVVDALVPGKLPAFGLRDHTVARRFRLAAPRI